MNLRPAQVRIYLDADLLGLGKILAGLRNDVTYPGRPRSCHPQAAAGAVPHHEP